MKYELKVKYIRYYLFLISFLHPSHTVSVLQSSNGLFLIRNKVFKPHKQPAYWKTVLYISAVSCGPHSLSSFLSQYLHSSTSASTHTHIPFYNRPSCVCPWTLIIDAHNIFSCIPIDPLIETSLICSLLLDIFSSPVSFFSKL